jgi:hypothetical protein
MSSLLSTRTAPATVSDTDSHVAAAWGLTNWEWSILTDSQRFTYRERIAFVHNLKTGK